MSAYRETAQTLAADDAARLREVFPIGSTVTTIVRHVTRSGMSRSIAVLAVENGEIRDYSALVARVTGRKLDDRNGGVRVPGVGMDMGFELVYSLARVLYHDEFLCTGVRYSRLDRACPSNDHANDKLPDYRHDRLHSDAGYALRHRGL